MYDTIIIGAGMSGLAAGIRLAYFGQRVCILERHYGIGGLNSFYRLGQRNYDVGLHAVTNYTPKGARRGPLARLLRQLRLTWDEFELVPQLGSIIAFPGVSLRFNNELELLRSEIAKAFPDQVDRFDRLVSKILDYDDIGEEHTRQSAREILADTITDPVLAEMLLHPLMFYGNAREHDMEFGQFCIMFRSIYMEGLARPLSGVRVILKKLVRKFKELGGHLRMRAGVSHISAAGGRVESVVLDNGEQLSADQVISSAGLVETMRLCSPSSTSAPSPGQLSFVESISILDKQPRDLGHQDTIVFFNDSEKFHWERPSELADVRSGVICSPNNFEYSEPPSEGAIRITALANYQLWKNLPEDEYRQQKLRWSDRMLASATRYIPDFRRSIVATDFFTPKTIHRFTGHDNGAVYGAPQKRLSGTTHLKNLFLCGTDQGFVGIIGAMMSGIAMANQHILKAVDLRTATKP